MLVHHGMETPLGKHIDQHGHGQRIPENRRLGVDYRLPGDRMMLDDRHELPGDDIAHLLEQLLVVRDVSV